MTSARYDSADDLSADPLGDVSGGPIDQLQQLRAANREIESLRQRLDEALRLAEDRRQANRVLDREVVQLRSMLAEAERQMGNIRQTFIYRIGEAIVSARTWKGLRQLPRRLIAIRLAYLEKRGRLAPTGAPTRGLSERLKYTDEALGLLARDGLEAAKAFIHAAPSRFDDDKSRALIELAHAVHQQDPAQAASLAVEAGGGEAISARVRALVLALFDHGEVNAPALILASLSDLMTSAPADRFRRATIEAFERQLASPFRFPIRTEAAIGVGCVAVIASRSPPEDLGPSSLRARSVADAAREAGFQTLLVTEPGFQYPQEADGRPALRAPGVSPVLRLAPASVPAGVFDHYIIEIGTLLAEEFQRRGVVHVHAVAETALAAASLWAARTVGATFTLDVGELPSFGGDLDEAWEARERFQAGLSLMKDMADAADHVVVRSEALAALLAARGVGAGRPVIISDPINGFAGGACEARVSALRAQLGLQDQPLLCVYGSIDSDPGLCDAVRALPALRAVEPSLLLAFAGAGPGVEMVRRAAVAYGLTEQVLFLSDLGASEWLDCLAASRIAIFPKHMGVAPGFAAPFEAQVALLADRPVAAADTPWARDWIADGETGLLYPAGDADALSEVVTRLLSDSVLAGRLASAGRRLVMTRSDCAVVDPLILATFGPRRADQPS